MPENNKSIAGIRTVKPTGLLVRTVSERHFWFGLCLVCVPVTIAIIGPLVAPFDPLAFAGQPFSPPDANVTLGTDNLGRDVFSRFLAGGRWLLILATLATVIGVIAGSVLGATLAVVRGAVDEFAMRAADVALAFPAIVLALMFLSLIGPQPWLIIIVVALGHIPRSLRVMRGAAMSVVERDFIKYGETIGFGRLRTVWTEVTPNVMAPLMVEFGIRFTYSVGLVASLSFLGLGVQPPNPDWGNMISENRLGITIQPWAVVLPLIALALLAIGCNLVTDCIGRAVGFVEGRRKDG
jgi:peptide/nickel transport system permease protein